MSPAVDQTAQIVLESHPAGQLLLEPATAIGPLDRTARQSVHVGADRVGSGPGQRGRTKSSTYGCVGRRRRRQSLGIGEVVGTSTEMIFDEIDGAIELIGHPTTVEAVEQRVGVGVRSDSYQAGSERIGESRPRRRATAVREPPSGLDELGCHEEGGRNSMTGEHGHRIVDEIGGPVIERDDDVACQRLVRQEAGDGLVEGDGPSAGRQLSHLLVEHGERQIDRNRGPRADAMVEKDDQALRGTAYVVGRFRDDLHGGSRYSHQSRIGRLPPMLSHRRKVALVSDSTISVRRASPDDITTAVELAGTALRWDPTEPNEAFFRWKHLDNPAGVSPMWFAFVGDTVAGFRSMMRWDFVHEGATPIRAVRAVDTATHPDFRRRGIFRTLTMAALEELTADGVDFVFNTPNPESSAGYLTMGWQHTGRVRVRFFPGRLSGPGRTIRARVAARKWSEPCSAGDPIDSIADELAEQSHELEPHGLATSHTGEYFRWRYGFEPLHYRVIRTDAASAVVRVRHRGPAVEIVVAELLATSRVKAEAVLRKVRREVGGDHLLVAAGGMAPLPPMLPLPGIGPVLVVRSMASHAPARSELRLSLGDVELF